MTVNVIVGRLGNKAETIYPYGINAMFSILSKVATLAEVLESVTAKANRYQTSMNIALTLNLGSNLK
ncbi:hypothetical protein H3T61_08725 [Gilliamella sp. B14384H2]|uniref:hypothetical protein n=1 Tax=unclassified Gilliamella TaxID=2685620 RepID=UPI0018DD1A49|nr:MULTISPECIES: hypothetical protein [unclassified Gilliamella]MBI0038308.1 hypothetical protein [Gilliamella sp. B14384G10]MBI0040395.1 hypothetical protein [Gilliamella sp. B14384G7]MBI0052234.1 hypothetical protein [Gilliamella sp. B14384G13]MBI0054595.1 hypothetical protein [Gilliamella sp. B14384H2]